MAAGPSSEIQSLKPRVFNLLEWRPVVKGWESQTEGTQMVFQF